MRVLEECVLVLIVFLTTQIQLASSTFVKYHVPYEYLATRTAYDVLLMRDVITKQQEAAFNSVCTNQTCFFAMFSQPGKANKYQLIIDIQNDCQTFPNCLAFTESQYTGSIVLYNSNVTNICLDKQAIEKELGEKFEMPVCPEAFNYNFTRANGRTWCWMFEVNKRTPFDNAREICHLTNSELNGFQSTMERDVFLESLNETVANTPFLLWYLLLGAQRDVDCNWDSSCAWANEMKWINNVSSNNPIANDITVNWDGNGRCLSMDVARQKYDDMPCTSACTYSCGKYADVYRSSLNGSTDRFAIFKGVTGDA